MKRKIWIILGCLIVLMGLGWSVFLSDPEVKGNLELKPYVSDQSLEQPVLTINQQPISLSLLLEEIRKNGGFLPGRFENEEQRQRVIDELIHFELTAQEAIKLNYDKDPEVQLAYKKLLVAKFKQEQIQTRLSEIIITEDMIKDYYEDHIKSYQEPGMYRLAVIFLRKSATGSSKEIKDLKKKMVQIRQMALQQKTPDFGKLAAKYSDDLQTKYKGGALPWLSQNSRYFRLEPEIVTAGFRLKTKGEISQTLQSENGIYLLKLIDLRPETTKPLQAVKLQIQADLKAILKQQWLDQFYRNLEQNAEITKNDKLLEQDVIWQSQATIASQVPTYPVK